MRDDIYVLDASAVLCLIYGEPGAQRVEDCRSQAVMSAINYAEVVTKLVERGDFDADTQADIESLALKIIPLDRETAQRAGEMRGQTRQAGLSLGDRCCLALAEARGAVALTADRAWTSLSIGVAVEVIR